ncbi:hypothetical protein L9F63_006451 [Diploptera punctata]|uniref:Thioredoxin domain-containing protein 12 n=1 Tax=Diploptera punctata TaxID=6984 RepID=A0AAD7ZAP0_DIPPU|nr:hypothetical protein L9F63_006451 [Diploptera punctata]
MSTQLKSLYIMGSVIFVLTGVGSQTTGRGFGEDFNWVNLDQGLAVAKQSQKPVMLVIHKSWCGACRALKPQFAASKEVKDLSKDFVMVNTQDDEEPNDAQYAPDGNYIPRILFIDPQGQVMTHVYNELGNPSYKYFYSDAESVTAAMRKVKDSMKKQTGTTSEEL